MVNFVNIPVNEINGKHYVSNICAKKAIDEAAIEQDWSDIDHDNALIKLRELSNRKFGFTYRTVVLVQCKCGHWEFFQIPGHKEITESFIEECFGDEICSICHMTPIQRTFIKESKKHVKEGFEDTDYSNALEKLKAVLDYYQGDESLDDKPGYLIEQSLRILDAIESYTNMPFSSVPEADLKGIFDEAENYAENLYEEDFEDEADEVWDALPV